MLPSLTPRDLLRNVQLESESEEHRSFFSDEGFPLLQMAADGGYTEIFKLVAEKTKGVKKKKELLEMEEQSILYAVIQNATDIVRYCLDELRFDVNVAGAKGSTKDTPLGLAARYGYPHLVELLFQYGGHINAVTNRNTLRPLDDAVDAFNRWTTTDEEKQRYKETIDMIVKYGGKAHAVEHDEYSPKESVAEWEPMRQAFIKERYGDRGMPVPFTPDPAVDDNMEVRSTLTEISHEEAEKMIKENKKKPKKELEPLDIKIPNKADQEAEKAEIAAAAAKRWGDAVAHEEL